MLSTIRPIAIFGLILAANICQAQSPPSPGPTNPVPPQSEPNSKTTIVINPTDEECRRGWDEKLRWTRAEFESFCTRLQTSK